VPWLLGARAMIHNSCTTGVEAAAMGVPAIAYRPLVAEGLDLVLPNAVSRQVFDEESLIAALRETLAGDGGSNGGAGDRRGLLAEHIAALDGPLAAERIADILVAIDAAGALAPRLPLGRLVSAHLNGRRRQLVRAVRTRRSDSRSNRGYLRHKFPGMTREDLQGRIRRLDAAIGGFAGIEVRALAPDIFELTI
jgi:hypothetical protein